MVLLKSLQRVVVHQVYEMAEFIGFETRNKYEVLDENKCQIAFVAEQQKGIGGMIARQILGHWRTFDIHFFSPEGQEFMRAHHPFRLFFQRLEVWDADGQSIGVLQQRFSVLSKRFDVLNADGITVMEMASPIWKIWTFPFFYQNQEIARISKKWSGALTEMFTDKDNFLVEYSSPDLEENERKLILAASIFIDLQYFENKSGSN